MKKTLSLLFTLLIFVGNAWGFSHNLFNGNEQHVKAKGWRTSGYVEATFNYHCLTTLKFKVASGTWNYDFNFKVECYDSSGNLVNSYEGSGAGAWSISKPYYEKTYNISCNVAKVKLINTNSIAALYFKEVCVEGVDDYFTIDDTQARNFGTKTIKSEYPINVTVSYSARTSGVSVSGEGFSINKSTLGSASGCASTDYVTVTFSPQAPKKYSGTLTIGGTNIELSGKGSLAVPQNLSVETPTKYTSARLTWDAVEGADKYYVYINGNKINDDPSTNSINLTNLTPNTHYSNVYVKSVAVVNNTDYPSNPSSSVEFTTKAINIPQNVTCTPDFLSATLNWTEVADKNLYDYYVIYRDGNQVGTSETNSYQISGLQWGVNYGNYTVKVHAFNTLSESSASCNVTTKTLLAPTGVSVSNIGYDHATVTWEATTAATSYKVYLSADGGISYSQYGKDVTEAPLKMEFTNLDLDKKYYVKVESVLNGKETDNAAGTDFTTDVLNTPTLSATVENHNKAIFSWNKVDDAKKYYVYYNGEVAQIVTAVEGQNTYSYILDNLEYGETYGPVTVKSAAQFSGKEWFSDASDEKYVTTEDFLSKSQNFSVSGASYSYVTGKWKSIEGADGYKIISDMGTTLILNVVEDELEVDAEGYITYVINGLAPNNTYTFTILGMYNGGTSKKGTDSNSISTKTTNCPAQVISNITLKEGACVSGGFNWDSANSAAIKVEKFNGTIHFSYTVNDLGPFPVTGYVFKLSESATGGSNDSEWEVTWSRSSKSGSVSKRLKNTTKYVRFTYGGNFCGSFTDIQITQGSYLNVTVPSLDFGTHYIGQSAGSKIVSVEYCTMVADISFNGNTENRFSSNKEQIGKNDCSHGTETFSVNADAAYTPGTYSSEIVIGDGRYNTKLVISALPAPENFVVSEQNPESTVLTWDDVNITETGYKVICKQGDNVIETKNLGGDATTCTFEGLQPNKEYTYIITTMYNSIENESAEITGKTNMLPAPQNFALDATSVRAFSAKFTWTKVTGATGYKLEWQWNEDVDAETAVVGDVSEYRVTGLKPNTTYSVKITTLYGDEEHGTSDAVEVTTTCVVNTTATGDEPTSQLHTITLLSGTQLDDLSYTKGSVIKFKSYTESQHIRFVQLNVTMNNSRVIYTEPEIELTVSDNIYIESVYEYAGIAQVVDEHGDVVYGTLTDAVNAAEEGATINLLGDVEQDMVVNKHIYFNGNGHDIDNLYIKKNGNVELTGDVTVVKDFGLEVTPDKAGQYSESGSELLILGDAYIDVQFDNVKRDKWYAFTVPFPVKMDEVKNAQTLSPLVYGTDYLFLGFDGEARAKGEKGWIRYTTPSTLEPGQLYMIGTYGSTVHRFYKVKSAALVSNAVSFDLESHASAKGGNLADWNALGNSQLFNVDANQHGTQFDEDVIAQIYQSATDSYLAVQLREHVMSVTNPIFVQKTEKCTNVSINKTDGLRSANAESALYNLQIAKEGATSFDDQMFVAASDNAPSEYVAGYALMKLGLTSSIAQIYSNMYNTNLCMIKAPYAANSVAEIPLTLYAPAAGNYTLSLGKQVSDGTALYLVKDGTEIHEFNADGSYTVYLAKGTSNSYSLRLKSTDSEDITTPAAETEAGDVKVYVQEGVLVIEGLAEGGSYEAGNMIRTLYSGISNGGDVRVPLTEKGVYWVNAGSAKVKVLNK